VAVQAVQRNTRDMRSPEAAAGSAVHVGPACQGRGAASHPARGGLRPSPRDAARDVRPAWLDHPRTRRVDGDRHARHARRCVVAPRPRAAPPAWSRASPGSRPSAGAGAARRLRGAPRMAVGERRDAEGQESAVVGVRRRWTWVALVRRTRIKPVNRERKAQRRADEFGCEGRHPACTGGWSEPSHVTSRGAGGKAEDIVPMSTGCHEAWHRGRETYLAAIGWTLERMVEAAAQTDSHASKALDDSP